MSIDQQPGKKPLASNALSTWGETTPEGQTALVVRFALSDRVVTFPIAEFRRWEHVAGEPEVLMISTGKEQIVIEGRELAPIRAALDLGRLTELRTNRERSAAQTGPCVRQITMEAK